MRGQRRCRWWLLFTLMMIVGAGCHLGVRPVDELEDIPRMPKEDLRARLNDPEVSIIDVRYTPNWKKSDRKIPGAVREDPMEVGSWIDRYPKDRLVVFYCD